MTKLGIMGQLKGPAGQLFYIMTVFILTLQCARLPSALLPYTIIPLAGPPYVHVLA